MAALVVKPAAYERDHLKSLGANGTMLLKLILKTQGLHDGNKNNLRNV
jgi:hypothetical protein